MAIISGGATGIGRATAVDFARNGAVSVIFNRDRKRALEVIDYIKKDIKSLNEPFFINLDVSDHCSVTRAVNEVYSKYGKIDILVHSAVYYKEIDFLEISDEEWERIIKVSLNGFFYLSKEIIRIMVKEKIKGKIIGISSVNAKMAMKKISAYSAAKSGMEGLARVIALEFADRGINVNIVRPGATYTELTSANFDKNSIKGAMESRIPMGKIATPGQISSAILFLASDLSNYITGQAIDVDGGLTLNLQ